MLEVAAVDSVGINPFTYPYGMKTQYPVVLITMATVLAAGCSGSEDAEITAAMSAEPTTPTPDATVTDPAAAEPTTSVPVASEPVATEPPPEPEVTAAAEQTPDGFSAIGPIVDAYVAEQELNGAGLIVVDQNDGVVYEDYWGEFSAERVSLIASSSKMISAGVLLALQDNELIDIDAPVADVTGWEGNPEITSAQLVSSASGLVGNDPDPAYPPYLCQFSTDSELEECGATIFQTPGDDADVIAPDSGFRYGGGQWQVAGAVAEIVSGKSWAELIDEIYVEPCELETLGFTNHWAEYGGDYPAEFNSDPSVLTDTKNPHIGSGAYATTGDYAKLLLMHLRGGMCGDAAVLSQEALNTMHTARITGIPLDGKNVGYGMGWWIDSEPGRISDPGVYGSVPWLDLNNGYGAYLVVEKTLPVGRNLAAQLYEPVKAAVLAGR